MKITECEVVTALRQRGSNYGCPYKSNKKFLANDVNSVADSEPQLSTTTKQYQ